MTSHITVLVLVLVIVLLFFAGIVWLQLFLSNRSSKWFGLIIPIIFFAFSLLFVLNMITAGSLWQTVILIVSTLLLLNIPTIILLAIYFACREKRKRKTQLEKMNIQDL